MEKKYTTLLFDADNTLLNFDKDEDCALRKTLELYGVPITEENITITIGQIPHIPLIISM